MDTDNPVPMPDDTRYHLATLLDRDHPYAPRLYVATHYGHGRRVSLDETNDPAEATDVAIPHTTAGDYVGSYVDRANLQALYGEFFLDADSDAELPLWVRHYGHDTTTLYLDLERIPQTAPVAFWDSLDWFCEAVNGLYEYPVYDEDEHSQVWMEAVEESIQGWAASDAVRDAERAIGEETGQRVRYGSVHVSDVEREYMESRAVALLRDLELSFPEADTPGLSVYFHGYEDVVATLADEILSHRAETAPETVDPVHNGQDDYKSFMARVSAFNRRMQAELSVR